ncbi:hypothetical protein KJ611_04655 [Patescibacteria group bacterium]|nr:hypothetical protein [Patescibacteria group bacterium]
MGDLRVDFELNAAFADGSRVIRGERMGGIDGGCGEDEPSQKGGRKNDAMLFEMFYDVAPFPWFF